MHLCQYEIAKHTNETGRHGGAVMASASVREFQGALDSTDEIELGVIGRRSGRELRRPVWFVLEPGRLYLVPVKGSDTEWYKNLRKTPTIALIASGVEWHGSAR